MDTPAFYPLTSAQRDLWVNQKMYPDLPIHCISAYNRLIGELNPSLFEQAIQHIISRNDSLRIQLKKQDDSIVQIVEKECDHVLDYYDLSDQEDPEKQALQYINDKFKQPLNLFAHQLFQIVLLKCSDDLWYWAYRFHHIINDGWGVSLFMQQMRTQYNTLLENGIPANIEPPLFLGIVNDEVSYLASDRYQQHQAYWKKRLAGHPGYASYGSTDERKQGLASIQRHINCFEQSLLDKVYHFADQHGLNVLNIFLGLTYLIASRRSGREDQIIGIPNLGRTGRLQKNALGMFVNMQPFRMSPKKKQQTFLDFIRSIKQGLLQDYRNHHLPFKEIYECSEISERNTDLFEVTFLHQKQNYNPGLGSVDGKIHVLKYGNQQAPLAVHLCELGESQPLRLDLFYHSAIYSRDEIKYLGRQFLGLMERLDDIKEQHLCDIEVLTEEEQDINLECVRNRQTLSRNTIKSAFARVANQYSTNAAVCCQGKTLSYRQLDMQSNTVARQLLLQGYTNKRIGLMVNRDEQLPILLLGILKANCTYVPLDSRYPQKRINYILSDAEVEVIIVDNCFNEVFKGYKGKLISPKEILEKPENEITLPDNDPDDIAYIIYTSGSTGQPKGVPISHQNVCRLFSASQSIFNFRSDDVWTLFHSYAFDMSVWEIFGAFLYGGKVIVVPEETTRNPAKFVDLLLKEKVTILNQTPSSFQYLIPEMVKRKTTGALRFVTFGGEKLLFHRLMQWNSVFGTKKPALVNMYGITETTVHVTYHFISGDEIESKASQSLIGKPLPDLDILLLNNQEELVPVGQSGEIYVGGAGLSQGYLNRPALNEEKFVPHPYKQGEKMYRSGDIARLKPNGDLEFIGRQDKQLQIRGFRVEIGEIEQVLQNHPDIEKIAVLPYQSDETELVAHICCTAESTLKAQAAREYLRGYLPEYMIPAHIFMVNDLPLTVNGKLDMSALPSPNSLNPSVADGAGDQVTHHIKTAWQSILGINKIDLTANFFDLGGNSLKMIKVQKELEKEFGTSIDLINLYRHPTVAKLTVYLNGQHSEHHTIVREKMESRHRQRGAIASGIRSKKTSSNH